MKVLFIHNSYRQRGGEDVALELESTLLAERGHEVRITIFSNDESPGLLGKIKLGWKAVYNVTSAKMVQETIQDFRPDVIHVHNWFFQASPSILFAAAKEKIPVVMTLHNYRLICANALLLRNGRPCELCVPHTFPIYGTKYKCYRNSSSQSALVTTVTGIHKTMKTWENKVTNYIVLTAFAKSRFIGSSFKADPAKLIIKPNFLPDPGEGRYPREEFFLFAGRLSAGKGVNVMAQAFMQMPQSRLMIVGDGEEKESLDELYSGARNIIFAGKRSRQETLQLMQRCKALIFPSLWYEGLPFTILEAFATGTPVIASKLGSMTEMITDGYNGLHFEAGNMQSLQNAVQRFEQLGSEASALYKNARQTYLEQYHPDIHYNAIMSIYEKSIANSLSANA